MTEWDGNALDSFQRELLRDLIAFPSVNPPGGEEPIARYLAGRLTELGFSVVMPTVQPGRANIVAQLKGGDGPEIALSGHLDVVAAARESWFSDPFALREDSERLYGRGVCDMKGAISSMVAAAHDLIAVGGCFAGTLTLLFVADEEIGTLGTAHYIESGERPDAVIIGEPTGMNICVAHRGVARYSVDVFGRAGHAARPDDAVNPIYIAAHLAEAADRRNRGLATRRHPVLPPPTLAVTMMEGGEQPNTIPARCRVTLDRRTLPDEGKEEVLAELEALRAALPEGEGKAVGSPEFVSYIRAGQLRPGSHLAEQCRDILVRLGIDARVRDFPAGCDQFAFTEVGVDCLLVGPGDIAQAHTVDEYVTKRHLAQARRFYREFIKDRLQWKTI